MIKKLAIFGVGLIGGSLAMALKKANYCEMIVGCDRDIETLRKAKDLGVIDAYTLEPIEAVKSADMILLAVPMRSIGSVLRSIKDHIEPNAIVTDTSSAKASVVATVHKIFGEVPSFFVPVHPIAGREKSGVEAAVANLYTNQIVIVTPLPETGKQPVQEVTAMWQAAGSEVESMPVKKHDHLLAETSHLPHVLAYSLVDSLSHSEVSDNIFRYAASGFRDFTRIASSDPEVWRDICLDNRDAILASIKAFEANLQRLSEQISAADGESLKDTFTQAKAARDEFMKKRWQES